MYYILYLYESFIVITCPSIVYNPNGLYTRYCTRSSGYRPFSPKIHILALSPCPVIFRAKTYILGLKGLHPRGYRYLASRLRFCSTTLIARSTLRTDRANYIFNRLTAFNRSKNRLFLLCIANRTDINTALLSLV